MQRKKKFAICVAVAWIMAAACGCAKSPPIAERICNAALAAVVEVQVRDGEGNVLGNATGTIISEDGKILTNRHVVRSYDIATKEYTVHTHFYVRKYNEEAYRKATLVRYAQDSDLALLQQEEKADKYFRFCKSDTLRYGQRVHTIGNGNGYGLAYAQGCVAAPACNVLYEQQTIRAVQLNLMFYEGNSGGPLLNDSGELVGVTTFRLRDKQGAIVQGTGFALPLPTVRAFLETENAR